MNVKVLVRGGDSGFLSIAGSSNIHSSLSRMVAEHTEVKMTFLFLLKLSLMFEYGSWNLPSYSNPSISAHLRLGSKADEDSKKVFVVRWLVFRFYIVEKRKRERDRRKTIHDKTGEWRQNV